MRQSHELLDEYKAKYGENLGEIFFHLRNDHADLWLTYKQYRTLFGTNKERIELLNRHAGSFFFNVERKFWNSCILSLCRMTDPEKQGSKANLTLYSLLERIEDIELREEVFLLIEDAKKLSEFARERHNKKIGHSDFEIRSQRSSIETIATRKKMTEAIDAAHKPLRLIASRVADVDMRPNVIDNLPNEIGLLYSLFAADYGNELLDEKRKKRWLNASPSEAISNNYPYPEWLSWKDEF